MSRRRRIGLLGGSFNPVHAGHLMLAQYIAEFGGLDGVWLLLSGQNPLKHEAVGVTDAQRFEMLSIACRDVPSVEASDFELGLPKPSFTYRTLTALRELYPDTDFSLLIGADNWLIFDRWRDSDRIRNEFDIVVYPRPGYEIDPATLRGRVSFLADAPIVEVSSTFIRRSIAEGHCMSQFVPSGVYQYILNNNLYGNERTDS